MHFPNPLAARLAGIETVYQELAVATQLDIAQNMFLGREMRKSGPLGAVFRQLDKKRMRRQAAEHMQTLGIRVQSIRQAVETLSGGQRQAVAVARAAAWGRKVVILDEPTAALGVRETNQVLELIRRVRDQGLSVVLISHSMPEVFAIADRIHIHRLGRRAAVVRPKTTEMSEVVAVMTGALRARPGRRPRFRSNRASLKRGRLPMSILDKFSLRGKVAVVTGGNRGIGRAIATGFAEAGAAVAIVARDQKKSEASLAALQAIGATAIAIRADVTKRVELQSAIGAISDALGPIDVWVNNAGIGAHADALTLGDSEWRRMFDDQPRLRLDCEPDCRRPHGGARRGFDHQHRIDFWLDHQPTAVAFALRDHQGGGAPPDQSLAAEWATKGVRVNAIAPGYVKTEIASTEYEEYRHYWRDEVPMQRYGSPGRDCSGGPPSRERRRLVHYRGGPCCRRGLYALVALQGSAGQA